MKTHFHKNANGGLDKIFSPVEDCLSPYCQIFVLKTKLAQAIKERDQFHAERNALQFRIDGLEK